MAMLDANMRRLPDARRALGACTANSLVCAALIVGQTLTLAGALANLWHGAPLVSQVPLIAGFFGCWCARAICSHVQSGWIDRFARHTADTLRTRALSSLYDAGPQAVAQRGSASLLTTLLEGADQVRAYLALTLPKTADLAVYTVVMAVALLALDPTSGIIAVAVVPVTIFFMRLLGGYTKENAGHQFAAYRRLANRFADSLRGMSVLAAFGAQETEAQQVYRSSEQLRERTIRTLKTATLNSLVLDLFRVFALAAVAILLGFRLMAGTVALFPALTVLMLVPELFGALRRWANDFHASLDGRNQLAALLNIIEDAPEPAPGSYPFAEGHAPSLAMDHVSFRYGEASANSENRDGTAHDKTKPTDATAHDVSKPMNAAPGSGESHEAAAQTESKGATETAGTIAACYAVTGSEILPEHTALQDITFSATEPCRIGIVGASGAGKTTLAQLIAGFSSPSAGTIEVNGFAGTTLACPSWRSHVAYLPQHPHLFNDTLRANIAFYRPDATEAEVLQAAETAGLNDLLTQLPQGLDTVLGEGGRGLSGGQAQRVALARVLLDDRRNVLIFDEPTAHLDIETELALKQNILQAMEGRLVFFATHRMHWMRSMDRIIVLDGGRMAQMGTFDELASKPGAFAQLIGQLRGTGGAA